MFTMGACLAVDEAAVRSRQLDRQNKKDFNAEKRIIKLLLLGTGKHILPVVFLQLEHFSKIVSKVEVGSQR